ncbi:MAG: hypothetical protein JRG96_05770 [Deltaproteobacteria bacterium]|nr:hypothetical protein [Deltaproteobacteria bacterium]MBW2417067.1 hypothetical protein [Deltaproteobacteria bacterium]
MVEFPTAGLMNDDPRKLSALITRVADLAENHSVGSMILGLVAEEGDQTFPEFADFLQAALRVEDGIFRMTRERVLLHLTDLDPTRARVVFGRILDDFQDEFPAMSEPAFQVHYFEVKPGTKELRTKDILTEVFPPRLLH